MKNLGKGPKNHETFLTRPITLAERDNLGIYNTFKEIMLAEKLSWVERDSAPPPTSSEAGPKGVKGACGSVKQESTGFVFRSLSISIEKNIY